MPSKLMQLLFRIFFSDKCKHLFNLPYNATYNREHVILFNVINNRTTDEYANIITDVFDQEVIRGT